MYRFFSFFIVYLPEKISVTMKKILFVAWTILALALSSCENEVSPEYSERPKVSVAEQSQFPSTALSGDPYRVSADIANPYGFCYVQILYYVEWEEVDDSGETIEHKEEMKTPRRTFRETTETIRYQSYIPGLDANAKNADLTVTWAVSVENEYGMKATSPTRTYTVINENPQE